MKLLYILAALSLVMIAPMPYSAIAQNKNISAPIALWEKMGSTSTEKDVTKPTDDLIAGKRAIRLSDVTNPTITIYMPPKNTSTGTAMVVCPGGGYYILAMDLEGTEICEWLNSIGVTAILLKYRVPANDSTPHYKAPLQDAQRAIGLVRYNAEKWGIDPNKIGIMGFSAGGHLSAAASTNYTERTYKPSAAADSVSCRPDFTMLVYPAYLSAKADDEKISPELHVDSKTPPTLIIQTEDDPIRVENSVYYYLALKKANVAAEMHLYAAGGHGYGLRPAKGNVSTWPARAKEWMETLGLLKK